MSAGSRGIAAGLDPRRLRQRLALVFLLLALPTGALLWHAFGQLKWQAYFEYRGQAEALTDRIDRRLADGLADAAALSPAAYDFLMVPGDAAGKVNVRSPLAAWPQTAGMPGLVGHFDVGPDGRFKTPLLPPEGLSPEELGIGADEYAARVERARRLHRILATNRVAAVDAAARPGAPAETSEIMVTGSRVAFEPDDARLEQPAALEESVAAADDDATAETRNAGDPAPATAPVAELGRLQDLKLDDSRQRRSQAQAAGEASADAPRERENVAGAPSVPAARRADLAASAPITAFDADTGPYEFRRLDSGHFALFRTVRGEDGRHVQGMLIDSAAFIDEVVAAPFRDAELARMSDLVVAWGDDVIRLVTGADRRSYVRSAGELEGDLLYGSRLAAPFGDLQLVYSINHLPPGPGAAVLGWTALVLALVFILAYVALYRLGLGQIRLARQQQDFVAAVSHELKTPLTSIRMYGEMLMQGWTDEDSRQRYYAYIHDEAERLTRLIANVLQLARISRNDTELVPRRLPVQELMSIVASRVAGPAERAGFELDVDPGAYADDLAVCVDPDAFVQILVNLADNAIKYSANAPEKRIAVAAAADTDGGVLFRVRDYGPGIPPDQLRKIFRLFYRPDTELTRETVGTGIGLAIVHQLTRAMGGTVDVVNRDPGAEFRLHFPAVS